jgi:two-component SAPR family response regulator
MNIIAVDDEQFALMDLRAAIEEALPDAALLCLDTSKAALEYASANIVDIAFLDINMGGMNGLELAKRLKGVHAKTNIVFVTGYSHYAVDAFGTDASDYLLKPVSAEKVGAALKRLRDPVQPSGFRIQVQCFGNFEVFADNRPVVFGLAKAKEMLAYLVDRQGAGITKKQLSAVLWEDDDYSRSRQSHLQVLVCEMMKNLKSVNADDIIIKEYNSLAVDKTKFGCDYYSYLDGDPKAINRFVGEYMAGYSWAEFTSATLTMREASYRKGMELGQCEGNKVDESLQSE